jgi:predicted TIM-barrel fold metal-dependent hydrolase
MERNRRRALIARCTTAFRFCDTSSILDFLPDDKFVRMVREHGSDRILMGSDYSFRDPG